MALEQTAKKLGVNLIHLELDMGYSTKEWKNLRTMHYSSVEDAALAYFEIHGWHGYSKEGGLLLNLIKTMSFPRISIRHRTTLIEDIYSQKVKDFYSRKDISNREIIDKSWLLNNVRKADRRQIINNFRIMKSKKPYFQKSIWKSQIICEYINTMSVLDVWPDLEEWMLLELFNAFGADMLHRIAEKFAENPYEYRKGWPDLTIWKDGEARFLEVKSPGDRLHNSQKAILREFIKPFGLNYTLIDVQARMD